MSEDRSMDKRTISNQCTKYLLFPSCRINSHYIYVLTFYVLRKMNVGGTNLRAKDSEMKDTEY